MDGRIINLRALAIILIVLGHSIIIYDPTFDLLKSNVEVPILADLKHIISFIQLKLFFSLSGFCLYYSIEKQQSVSILSIILNKFGRLILPYLFVAFVWMDPIKYMLGISGYESWPKLIGDQIIGINCGHLWYLPCLYLIFITIGIWLRISNKYIWVMGGFVIFAIANYFYGRFTDIFQISSAVYYSVYFFFGYCLNYVMHQKSTIAIMKQNMVMRYIILIVAIIMLVPVYYMTSIGFELYLSLLILCGIYTYCPGRTNRIIRFISDNSYGLYLFHSPLIYITAILMPDISPIVMVSINFIVFGCFSILLAFVLSRTRMKYLIGGLNLKIKNHKLINA